MTIEQLKLIEQAGITLFGCTSIWMVGRREHWARFGYLLGMLGQPFWACMAWRTESWGVGLLVAFYTYSWAQGIWNHLIRPIGKRP